MKLDFDDVKETVRTIALRLDSPASNYSFLFSESDDAVEVRVEVTGRIDPLFVFIVDAERFRVIKAVDINPEGYASFPYHSYVELLSYIIEHFYPVFLKLTNGGSITDMLSRVFGEKVRIWKDLLRIICKSADVEYKDRGVVFSFLDTNFVYNSNLCKLILSGEVEEECKVNSVMELVITLFTVVGYLFQLHVLDANPILGTQLVEEADPLAEDEMALEEDIDNMDMGDVFDEGGDMAMGEDLSAEFEPAGDSIENTAPDLDSGKEQVLDEIQTSYKPLSYGGQLIASGGGAWFSPNGDYFPLDRSHEYFVNENRDLFNVPVDLNGDDLVLHALSRGWVRIRGQNPNINIEVKSGSKCLSSLSNVAYYLINDLGLSPNLTINLDVYNPSSSKGFNTTSTLQELLDGDVNVPSYLTQRFKQERFECADVDEIQTSYKPLYSNKNCRIIKSSPDKAYEDVAGEIRTYLDGICKKVQSNNPNSTISPITNLTWRVARGDDVLLQIVCTGCPIQYNYSYLDASGQAYSGVIKDKGGLKSLLSKVGK